ncbi:MAG: DeoR family transcriptional regulator, partial [Verrucomicrobiota bacterium]|nr:DeoR family transcriptional regulator [Verrucomicrobiota bacterium]
MGQSSRKNGARQSFLLLFLQIISNSSMLASMLAEERQQRINEHLREKEFCTLKELSEMLNVSVSTVRRDINFLKTTGVLRRTHGGARLSEQVEIEGTHPLVPNASVR